MRHRAGDNQRGAGFVDENRVDFVHDGIMEIAMYAVFNADGHIVAKVVEAEFVVGAVGNVARVLLAAHFGVHVMLDAADGQAQRFVDFTHPLGVAERQVIVDCNQVDAFAFQGIKIHWEGGDQCFALSGGHLGDLALMKYHAADQLDVVRDHVPLGFDFRHRPALPDQPPTGLLDRGKGFGEDVIQRFALGDTLFELLGLALQFVIGEIVVCRIDFVDLLDDRADAFDVPFMLGTEYFGQKPLNHNYIHRLTLAGRAHQLYTPQPENIRSRRQFYK